MPELTLFGLLAEFLRHPVVELKVSDSGEVETLKAELEAARAEAQRASARYAIEVSRVLRYEDYLKSIGVKPSDLL